MSENKHENSLGAAWQTKITEIKENEIRIHGYRLDELMGKRTFSEMVFLMLKGRLPTENEGRLLDIMLVSCIDHGVTPPSALAALTAASTGAPYNSAIAAGILSINEHHGGAIENAMRMLLELRQILDDSAKKDGNIKKAVELLMKSYNEQGRKLPGFGHRIHKNDPRTKQLLKYAKDLGQYGKWVSLLMSLKTEVDGLLKRDLPVNVDGAIAALLLELGIAPELANSFFIISRVPGLVAHIYEEKSLQKPMRRIDPVNHIYTGTQKREV